MLLIQNAHADGLTGDDGLSLSYKKIFFKSKSFKKIN